MRLKHIFQFGLLLIFLSNCAPNPNATNQLVNIEFTNQWLDDKACIQPCWQNIQPGQTTIDEAIKKLNLIPEIIYIEQNTSGSSGVVYWDVVSKEDSWVNGQIFYSTDTQKIEEISYQTKGSISVQDVFENIGEPSHIYVDVSACHTEEECPYYGYSIHLSYINEGIMLSWGGRLPREDKNIPDFDSNVKEFEVRFLSKPLNEAGNADPNLHIWAGFTSFEDYCTSRSCSFLKQD